MTVVTHERADEVADLEWPAEAARRDALAAEGRPRLLIVAEGLEPPTTWDPLEDWARQGADAVELCVRRERLRRRVSARAPAVIDDDGLLHRGPCWVALPPTELRVVSALLARPGRLVARADLAAVAGTAHRGEGTRTLDGVVRRVRRRIAPLGMVVCAVRGAGFLLEMGELPVEPVV